MSKVLSRARVKLLNAQNSYKRINNDDAFLDDCCYNLQQFIEMTLNYLVEAYGGYYVENHNIRVQLDRLRELNVSIPREEFLRQNADKINEWEMDSRYSDGFIAPIDTVEKVLKYASELLSFVDRLERIPSRKNSK